MPQLDLQETTALETIVRERVLACGLEAWLKLQEERYTRLCREQQNSVPETLDADLKKRTLCAQYAAKAQAYGSMFRELNEQFGVKPKAAQ